MLRQYIAYAQVLVWKLLDTLRHGEEGTPRRLELTPRGVMELPRRSLLRDLWLQTHMFLCLPATPILDRLWVGSALNAANKAWLKSHAIRFVVNVSQEVPNLYEDELDYCQLTLRDVEGCTIPWHWTSLFIHRALATGQGVLIHCFLGRSRSVAVACHYLMSQLGYSFQNAYKHVSHQRPIASLNVGLAEELAAQEEGAQRLRLHEATSQ